jgi:hypothetical protein
MRKWMKEKTMKMFQSKEVKAELAMSGATQSTVEVGSEIRNEVAMLGFEVEALQKQLAQDLQNNCGMDHITNMTKRIKMIQRNMEAKRRLLSNMEKEKQQLADASVNLKVTRVMKDSLEAQKQLAKLQFDDDLDEIDELLDNIDENRVETQELTERLGQFGVDENDDIIDSSFLKPEDVFSALGYASTKSEQHSLRGLKQAYGELLTSEFQNQVHVADNSSASAGSVQIPESNNSSPAFVFPKAPESSGCIKIKSKPEMAKENGYTRKTNDGWNF